jgi:hypothetical protein
MSGQDLYVCKRFAAVDIRRKTLIVLIAASLSELH